MPEVRSESCLKLGIFQDCLKLDASSGLFVLGGQVVECVKTKKGQVVDRGNYNCLLFLGY